TVGGRARCRGLWDKPPPVFGPFDDPAPTDHLGHLRRTGHSHPNVDPVLAGLAAHGDDRLGLYRHGLREGAPAFADRPGQLSRLEIPAGVRHQASTIVEVSLGPACTPVRPTCSIS